MSIHPRPTIGSELPPPAIVPGSATIAHISPATVPVGMPSQIGKYSVLSRIGVGAMGVVYKCSQPGLDRPVAVKVLTASRHAIGEQLLRFQRESKAASRLTHPNVVQIYDVGTDGELNYFVMEFVDGYSLDKLIGSKHLTVDHSIRLLVHIARALQAAHDQGIIHRDIKPSNILIHHSGQPKLADFGLAKSLHDGPALSRSGDIIGTPRYMSPEQVLLAPAEIDSRTDIYSLGAVMYEMLTRQPPVTGPNILAMLRSLTDDELVPVEEVNPGIPEQVATICHRALAKDRDQRYATAGELAEALQNYLLDKLLTDPEPLSLPLKPGSSVRRTSPNDGTVAGLPAPRRRQTMIPRFRWALLGIVALLGAIGAAAFIAWPHKRGSAQPVEMGGTEALLAHARTRLEVSPRIRTGASPRERSKLLIDDLSAVLKQAPDNVEARLLRGRAYRLAGECQAAVEDMNLVLRQEPDNVEAIFERLLAIYQLHVLYLGNLNEPLLRIDLERRVRDDVKFLLRSGDPAQKYAAKLVESLAHHAYAEAGQRVDVDKPDNVPNKMVPDLAMLEADALYQAATVAHAEEVASNGDKEAKRIKREDLVRRASLVMSRGRSVDPHHVGLLFLLANSFQRGAVWGSTDGESREATLRRQRPAFEKAYDRLREVTLRQGCDTAVMRAVLWHNYGRDDMALEEMKEAQSCDSPPRSLHTFKAWLRLHNPTDGHLTTAEVASILADMQPMFETPPNFFNPYFVHALVEAAGGQWEDARHDLRQGRRKLPAEQMASSVPLYNKWFAHANASDTEYLEGTQELLDALPVPSELRMRLAEEVLKRVSDPVILEQDGLKDKPQEVRIMKAWSHYRLAKGFAEKKDRSRVLYHLRAALEQKLTSLTPPEANLTVDTFRNDALFSEWKDDDEFRKLYLQFER